MYVTKNQEELIYLGRHSWFEVKHKYDAEKEARVGKKHHIFYDPNWKGKESWQHKPRFKPIKSVPNMISKQVSDGCHDDFANLVDEYLKTREASAIVEWKKLPIPAKDWEKDWDKTTGHNNSPCLNAAMEENGEFVTVTIGRKRETTRWDWRTNARVQDYTGPKRLAFSTSRIVRRDGTSRYVGSGFYRPSESDRIVTDKSKFFYLYAVYANGREEKWSG
jgi:hypothetical protein